LRDIEEAATKIQRYTNGLDFEAFVRHEMAYDAVLRNLEIIGEAANGIPSTKGHSTKHSTKAQVSHSTSGPGYSIRGSGHRVYLVRPQSGNAAITVIARVQWVTLFLLSFSLCS
jgi:hypothetical protein